MIYRGSYKNRFSATPHSISPFSGMIFAILAGNFDHSNKFSCLIYSHVFVLVIAKNLQKMGESSSYTYMYLN